MPLTESDSCTRREMSASVSSVVLAIARRSLPTRRGRETLRDRAVEDLLQQESWDDAEPGREDDQREHGREAAAVRREEAGDAAQVRAAHGGVLRAHRRLLRVEVIAETRHLTISVRRAADSRS